MGEAGSRSCVWSTVVWDPRNTPPVSCHGSLSQAGLAPQFPDWHPLFVWLRWALPCEATGCSFGDLRMPKVELQMNRVSATKALGEVLWVPMRKWRLLLPPAYIPFSISIPLPFLEAQDLPSQVPRTLLLSSCCLPLLSCCHGRGHPRHIFSVLGRH